MNFSCEKALLQNALLNVSRAAPTRSNLAALEGILIEADERLKLTGYNLEVGISERLDADITAAGSAVVQARLLTDIVRRLPDDMVSVSLNDKMVLHITCGGAEFDIASCLEGGAFPRLPAVEKEKSASLPQKMLREMIHGTIFAVAGDENKTVHRGSKFIWEDGCLIVLALDGYRLALRREAYEGEAPGEDFVVPGNALREVERLLGDGDDDVNMVLGGRHILFEMGGVTLTTRLLEGEFMNYRTTIPGDQPVSVELNADELVAGLERVSLLISEKVKTPVRLTLEEQSIGLSCATALGAARDRFPALVSGLEETEQDSAFEIGFNHRYLLDALRALPDHECVIRMTNPLSPCVIMPKEGDAFVYMVLPVRLRVE